MSYEDYLDVAFFMNMWCCLWFFCVWTREHTAKVLNLSSKMNEKKQKQKPKRMLLNNERPFINWWCTCSCVSILKAAKEDEGLLFKAPSLSSKIASELNSRMCDVENKSHSAFDDRTMISAATKASRLFWQKKKNFTSPRIEQPKKGSLCQCLADRFSIGNHPCKVLLEGFCRNKLNFKKRTPT